MSQDRKSTAKSFFYATSLGEVFFLPCRKPGNLCGLMERQLANLGTWRIHSFGFKLLWIFWCHYLTVGNHRNVLCKMGKCFNLIFFISCCNVLMTSAKDHSVSLTFLSGDKRTTRTFGNDFFFILKAFKTLLLDIELNCMRCYIIKMFSLSFNKPND